MANNNKKKTEKAGKTPAQSTKGKDAVLKTGPPPAKLSNPRAVATDEFGNEIDPATLTPEERVRIQRANASLQEAKLKAEKGEK